MLLAGCRRIADIAGVCATPRFAFAAFTAAEVAVVGSGGSSAVVAGAVLVVAQANIAGGGLVVDAVAVIVLGNRWRAVTVGGK